MILALTVLLTEVEASKIYSTMFLHASLLFALLSFANAAADTSAFFICLYKASARQLASMTLRLFHGSMDRYTEVPIVRAVDLMRRIDKSKKTVLVVPHFMGFIDLGQQADIVNAYLALGYYNVMWLQWDQIANNPMYTFSACSTPDVGIYVGNALDSMVASGLDPTTLSLVGHSLGGQAVGAIGRSANFPVGMIVGLDPAGPGFDFLTLAPTLSSSDAEFVIAVHTDRGRMGVDLPVGDADFYPNEGTSPQPGCLPIDPVDDICSHIRGMSYWVQAVANQKAFLARECDSWNDFEAGLCDSNEVIEMSPDTPTTARGSYFLHTGSRSPFGLGEVGVDGQRFPFYDNLGPEFSKD